MKLLTCDREPKLLRGAGGGGEVGMGAQVDIISQISIFALHAFLGQF